MRRASPRRFMTWVCPKPPPITVRIGGGRGPSKSSSALESNAGPRGFQPSKDLQVHQKGIRLAKFDLWLEHGIRSILDSLGAAIMVGPLGVPRKMVSIVNRQFKVRAYPEVRHRGN